MPLMFWFPRLYRSAVRSKTIGGHVDLAPTIADLAGVPAAPDWQGRSLFDTTARRARISTWPRITSSSGVREGNWKYILDLREGVERAVRSRPGSDRTAQSRGRRTPTAAPACGSGWPRGPRPTDGSTSAPRLPGFRSDPPRRTRSRCRDSRCHRPARRVRESERDILKCARLEARRTKPQRHRGTETVFWVARCLCVSVVLSVLTRALNDKHLRELGVDGVQV